MAKCCSAKSAGSGTTGTVHRSTWGELLDALLAAAAAGFPSAASPPLTLAIPTISEIVPYTLNYEYKCAACSPEGPTFNRTENSESHHKWGDGGGSGFGRCLADSALLLPTPPLQPHAASGRVGLTIFLNLRDLHGERRSLDGDAVRHMRTPPRLAVHARHRCPHGRRAPVFHRTSSPTLLRT